MNTQGKTSKEINPIRQKKSEKCMRFDLVARDLNPFNEVSFGNTKTDLVIRPSTSVTKTRFLMSVLFYEQHILEQL